mmetsp:Transcript_10402/g.12186  ORF Transcript_10402/g.12186 Transcript_10402/m.12186 type:complete len:212 (-) Transcript_10402:271-906(-)|eukprot:CAMPEP_0197848176 /NCGR_PEP_ID=MMETSP1438-20131217/7966_1 /TAXON_ID=1461541 /ORGANISM="Pterosperma sp., Strain CCMP1384" /LENGTH=211 /DNA_ID=CAMNT_0043460315 /DNA_START=222 /DNA_END=857 /DNA_ORIENTATION=-
MPPKLMKVKSWHQRVFHLEKDLTKRYKEVQWLKGIFDQHDVNHDGAVSVAEFLRGVQFDREHRTCSRTGKRSERKVHDLSMFRAMDKNADDVLDFSEYLKTYFDHLNKDEIDVMLDWVTVDNTVCYEKKKEQELESAREIYGALRKDHNGLVNRDELIALGYDEVETETLFEIYDKNQDNGLDLDEYLELYEKEYLLPYKDLPEYKVKLGR